MIKYIFTPEKLKCACQIRAARYKPDNWTAIREIYNYLCKQAKGRKHDPQLYLTYNYLSYPHEMTAEIMSGSTSVFQAVILSDDEAIAEKTKQLFDDFGEIEDLYRSLQITVEDMQERKIKRAERDQKRQQTFPDINKRYQKAWKYLKKYGYTLHTESKTYQIENDNTMGIVAGEYFELSIDDVEKFIQELEYKIDPSICHYPETDIEKREKQAKAQLKLMGLKLKKIRIDIRYRAENYKIIDSGKQAITVAGKTRLSLRDVESFILSNN